MFLLYFIWPVKVYEMELLFFLNNCPLSIDLASVPLLCALPFLIPKELSTLIQPAGYLKPAHGPRIKMGKRRERMFDVSKDQRCLG